MKSRPFTYYTVEVEVETSCKDNEPLKTRVTAAGNPYNYCNDDPSDANKATEPLAMFLQGNVKYPKHILKFTKYNWDKPQLLTV